MPFISGNYFAYLQQLHMHNKAILQLLLILSAIQITLVLAQGDSKEFVFAQANQENIKLTIPQEKKFNQETLTYRSMVRAQNLAKAAYNNEKYGEYFTSGETIFTSYTNQEFIKLFTGYLPSKAKAHVEKPSKGSIRNLQESSLFEGKSKDSDSQSKSEDDDNTQQNTKINEDEDISEPIMTEEQNQRLRKNKADKTSTQVIRKQSNTFTVDYQNGRKKYVTSVKNQGQCGSCWAFSTTGQFEAFFIRTKVLTPSTINIAEQQCTDCAVSWNGCNGAYSNSCPSYAKGTGVKLCNQTDYPYIGVSTSNKASCKTTVIAAKGFWRINKYRAIIGLTKVTARLRRTGPISACMYADNKWQNYIGGVINGCSINTQGGHCVLLTGAKSDETTNVATNYWRFRNSWSTGWGQLGYFKAYRSKTDLTVGYCKMLAQPQYQTTS